ncbi:MAG: chromosome segregation protein SMC [Defluviitaleaceae bacterium]|nr:chromosome segregation protein SMC [Defluviitaleaceae bacterium]
MYLKKLELAGFKSFADRISLDFAPGLNAVVGPNGSGKSNIADALRWVLGEQSAKQLRGGKMEDVIFAGTAHRKPLGYAEIAMRLDNSDGALPLEFNEIAVTRRVYRSGESEYLLNGENCRLKDIRDLFMDTGVGRDGYSIIGQGRIDEILSLRSEERRHVFEEAAGISKFKARRSEALNKLEREKQNRERVDDIISELEEQLEPLESQAEEARKFLELRDEYKSIHINIFLEDIRKINEDLTQTEAALADISAQSGDGKRLLSEARTAAERLKARAADADAKYRRANEILLEATTEIEKQQGEIKILQNREEQLEVDISRLKGEAEKRVENILLREGEKTEQEQAAEVTQNELNALNEQLAEQLALHAKHEDELREGAAETDALNQSVMTAMNAATDARAAVIEAENAYSRLEEDMERLNTEIDAHEEKLAEQTAARTASEASLASCEKELAAARKNEEAYTAEYNKMRADADALEKNLRELTENLTASRGRFRALSDLEAAREGYHRSVKAVLSRKKDAEFAGICGAVGELIGVPREFEVAIEIALGGAAQNIVTQNEGDAKHAIEFLKRTSQGRATFLPLTAVKGRNIDTYRIKNEPGYIGIASEIAECEGVYAPVISQLLGDIVLVDTLENALAMHKKFRYSYKIVTKAGERLSPGGAITGGSIARQSAGIIGRARQLDALKAQVDALQADEERLSQELHALNERRRSTREILQATREKISAGSHEEIALKNKIADADENLTKMRKSAQEFDEREKAVMAQILEANTTVREAKIELALREKSVETARVALDEYQKEIEKNRQSVTEESDVLTDLRIEITQKTDAIAHSAQNIARLTREIDILNEEKKLLDAEAGANESAAQKSAATRAEKITQLEQIQTRLDAAKISLTESETEKATLDAAITETESDERTHADAAALIERETARLEARKENLDAASRRFHDEIWEEYSLTFAAAEVFKRTDLDESTLRKRGRELKFELAKMSDVNVGAIETFKQIQTRHGFLTTQRDDILAAEAALDELIVGLTEQMEAQFAEKFKLIASHFQDVFAEMFVGGTASIRITDPENVLESGIEIIAKPPGKSLQSLMLLSGGERALTAIALLFAILRMKPSPFCVLDEIESALDDANITRFAKFLKQHAVGTQFIIITHRKGTMEAADNLYGVTMEEQGVSKLVSVKFV